MTNFSRLAFGFAMGLMFSGCGQQVATAEVQNSNHNVISTAAVNRYVESWDCKVVSMTGMIQMPQRFQVKLEGKAANYGANNVALNIDRTTSQTFSLSFKSETISPAAPHKISNQFEVSWIETVQGSPIGRPIDGALQLIGSNFGSTYNAILHTSGEQGLFSCKAERVFTP